MYCMYIIRDVREKTPRSEYSREYSRHYQNYITFAQLFFLIQLLHSANYLLLEE